MPKFTGKHTETFEVDASVEDAVAHFGDLETIAANYGNLQSHEILGGGRMRLVLNPRSERGVTFSGRYTGKWTVEGDRVSWASEPGDNMESHGSAQFTDVGGRTRVRFEQNMTCDMQVNRLLAKIARPIVERHIATGVSEYLERMRAALAAKG